jgi:myo-inositol 2-dehydrogenase/D-chiro-inositol 1-dehydrogenase
MNGRPTQTKTAIIGFGRLAQIYYAAALRRLPNVEIVAAADPLAASRAAAAAKFPHAHIYADYHDLFEREHIDAVLVASPPSTHRDVWSEAARCRVPAFVEKPFVLPGELAHVESSPESSQEVRQLLMPNFNRRFWPAYRELRDLCQSPRFGIVERAEFSLIANIRPWNTVTQHRLASGEGGALYDLASSELDLIEYVFGEKIVSLRAQSETIVWPDDHVRLSLKLKRGLSVSCEIGYASSNCEKIAITGTKASARIENPNAIVHVEPREQRKRKIPLADWMSDTLAFGLKALRPERTMLRYTIAASLAAFFEALSMRQPFSPSFDDAIWNATCLEAAVRSIRENRFIEVSALASARNVNVRHQQA